MQSTLRTRKLVPDSQSRVSGGSTWSKKEHCENRVRMGNIEWFVQGAKGERTALQATLRTTRKLVPGSRCQIRGAYGGGTWPNKECCETKRIGCAWATLQGRRADKTGHSFRSKHIVNLSHNIWICPSSSDLGLQRVPLSPYEGLDYALSAHTCWQGGGRPWVSVCKPPPLALVNI